MAKDIPDNSVVIGNPMRIIGTWDDYMNKNLESVKDSFTYQLPSYNQTLPCNAQQDISIGLENRIGYVWK